MNAKRLILLLSAALAGSVHASDLGCQVALCRGTGAWDDSPECQVVKKRLGKRDAPACERVNAPLDAPPEGGVILLQWNPNADPIQGYRVYVGATPTSATRRLAELSIHQAGFNPRAPAFTVSAARVGLRPGAQGCFRVTAYTTTESALSAAVCTRL